MKPFLKDIVIVDFEVTDFDFITGEPVQIGVLVLDKDTLEEKGSFVSWIKAEQDLNTELPGLKWATISEIDIEEIKKAPSLEEIAKEIIKILPDTYSLCAWNANFDFNFWNKLLAEVDKKIRSTGVIDLWTLAYIKLLKDANYNGDFKSESVFQYFGADPRLKHDALGDCKIEAMVFKNLIK